MNDANDIYNIVIFFTSMALITFLLKRLQKTQVSDWIKSLASILALVYMFFFFRYTYASDKNSLLKNGVETIGTIEYSGTRTVKWTFRKENETITIKQSQHRNLEKGERFKAVYDKTAVHNARIYFDKPYIFWFEADTINNFKIKTINKRNVSFSFFYNGNKYYRIHEIPEDEDWTKIENFYVVLNTDNPKIAYLKRSIKK